MTVREAAATMAFGLEAVAKQPDLLILCDLAPGSIHAGAALISGLTNDTAKNVAAAEEQAWTGRALARARATSPKTPIEWMAALGGREIADLAGAIIAARVSGVPVLVEGVAALAATLAVYRIDPTAIAHVRVAGAVNHPAHARALLAMGITPLTGLTLPGEEGAAGLAVLAMMRLASDD